jgi:hypothetical protein
VWYCFDFSPSVFVQMLGRTYGTRERLPVAELAAVQPGRVLGVAPGSNMARVPGGGQPGLTLVNVRVGVRGGYDEEGGCKG